MSTSTTSPLLTLALIGYRQEQYIEAAIRSAFEQTYQPLEILLSDDNSPDGTFGIMQRMAAEYRGPHRVVLNQNVPNRRIGGHINRLFELARGELVLLAAGDDLSLPDRVRRNFECWDKFGRQALCLYSAYHVRDGQMRPMPRTGMEFNYSAPGAIVNEVLTAPEFFTPAKPRIFGCAAAYSPRLFTVFGGLSATVVHEDDVLAFRAALLGPLVRIEEPLVEYRLHGSNAFGSYDKRAESIQELEQDDVRTRREFKSRVLMYEDFIADLKRARELGLIGAADCETALEICAARKALEQGQSEFHQSGLARKCRLLVQLWRGGLSRKRLTQLVPRVLPDGSFRALKLLSNRVRNLF